MSSIARQIFAPMELPGWSCFDFLQQRIPSEFLLFTAPISIFVCLCIYMLLGFQRL